MTGPDPAWDPWTDQSYLRESQYKTDVNLAARQSIYAYQQPRIDLARETLELAGPDGHETVADIGCGNGRYLAELARRVRAEPRARRRATHRGRARQAASRPGAVPDHHPQRLPRL